MAEAGSEINLSCADPLAEGISVLPAAVMLQVERWLKFLTKRGLDELTVKQHRSYTTRFVLEFFGRVAKEPDLAKWPDYCGRYYNWLASEAYRRPERDHSGKTILDKNGNPNLISGPCSSGQIQRANISLLKFYRWLGEEGIVPAVELKLRSPISQRAKPQLLRPVDPDEVLQWASSCPDEVVRFIGLAGYFFSLRPQEVFALRRKDFRAGAVVEQLECIKAMNEANLFNKLAVHVGRQKQNRGSIKDGAKAGSDGWVACFNGRAAVEVVSILNKHDPEAVVAKWNNAKLYDDWKRYGIVDLTVKDLRRASLYWLGHYSGMPTMQLMKHARHRNVQTTMIYCQRPEEDLRKFSEGDLCLELNT
jgi:integrase